MHPLTKERCFFYKIDDCKATNSFVLRFTAKKEPIIVTISIDIIL